MKPPSNIKTLVRSLLPLGFFNGKLTHIGGRTESSPFQHDLGLSNNWNCIPWNEKSNILYYTILNFHYFSRIKIWKTVKLKEFIDHSPLDNEFMNGSEGKFTMMEFAMLYFRRPKNISNVGDSLTTQRKSAISFSIFS